MPSTQLRQTVLANAKRVVVKLGTQILTGDDGRLDVAYLEGMADQIAALRQRGISVTMVSSGAVGAGLGELSLTKRPTDVAELQAVAAVGQPRLMVHLTHAFARHGLHTAQMLLTRGDFDDRARFLNIATLFSSSPTCSLFPSLDPVPGVPGVPVSPVSPVSPVPLVSTWPTVLRPATGFPPAGRSARIGR